MFRGTPVLVQIMFIWLIIPGRTVGFGAFTLKQEVFAGILALGVNEGAYMREIIRAGIDSIDKGQMRPGSRLGCATARSCAGLSCRRPRA